MREKRLTERLEELRVRREVIGVYVLTIQLACSPDSGRGPLTELDYESAIKTPVPHSPEKLRAALVSDNGNLMHILRTRGAVLKRSVG